MTKQSGRRSGRMVYSTELGRTCPDCREQLDRCRCSAKGQVIGDGRVRVRRESRRGGKGVTIITGLPLADATLRELAGTLRKRCGSGGTVKDGNIEIQGDHRELILAELLHNGFAAKLAGG